MRIEAVADKPASVKMHMHVRDAGSSVGAFEAAPSLGGGKHGLEPSHHR